MVVKIVLVEISDKRAIDDQQKYIFYNELQTPKILMNFYMHSLITVIVRPYFIKGKKTK